MKVILSGSILWSFDVEVQNRNKNNDFTFHVSGMKPFHCYAGEIFLTERSIKIIGDSEFEIRLENLTQIYLGFDENYSTSLSKNFGVFWQPLRLTLLDGQMIYLIIDYNFVSTNNKLWFHTLQELLA